MIYTVITVLILAAVFFVYRESSGYNIVEYTVDTDKDIGEPVRFVMISDLHDTDVTGDGNKRLLESVRSLDPCFVILAGDIITSYQGSSGDSSVAYSFLKGLSEICPVYYGLGNHEQRYKDEPDRFPGRYKALEDHVSSLGIKLLSDGYADAADQKIRIYGFDIPLANYKRAVTTKLPEGILEDIFSKPDKNLYNILIAHSPDFFDEYARFGPDLVLAGHLHGGIIGFPGIGGLLSPQLKLFPEYDSGRFTKDDTTMIVSRGIGWHSIPIRIFNKAEMVSVTVQHKKEGNDQDGDQC